MAKVQLGGGVAAISGKSGGTVFARNKGGAYMRNFVVPTNPSTVYQEEARDRLAQYSNEWRTLTDAQREAWNAWAAEHPVIDRLGASKNLTGAQAYTKINTNRDLAGDATANATTPSDPAFVNNIIDVNDDINADVSSNAIVIYLGAGAAENQVVFLYMSPAISPGITNAFNLEKFLGAVTITAAHVAAGDINVTNLWLARYGTLTGTAGKKLSAHLYQYLQGQTGSAYPVTGIITA